MNVSIYFDRDLIQRIDQESKRLGISRSELVQTAVKDHFARRKKELPPKFVELAGSWQDKRTAEEILSQIDTSGVP